MPVLRLEHGFRRLRSIVAVGMAAIVIACSSGPQPIAYGRDECVWCHMLISDQRYGAELVNAHGKALMFDSIECLVSYYESLGADRDAQARSLWVTDYVRPGTLISAGAAHFVHVEGPASPMGRGIFALASVEDAGRVEGRTSDAPMAWDDVLAMARREGWGAPHAGAGAADAGSAAH